MLNNASLAMSVVGLTGKFLGACMRLLLCIPEIMRIYLNWFNMVKCEWEGISFNGIAGLFGA